MGGLHLRNTGVPILLRLEILSWLLFSKNGTNRIYEFRKYQDSDLRETMCYYKSPPEVCDSGGLFGLKHSCIYLSH